MPIDQAELEEVIRAHVSVKEFQLYRRHLPPRIKYEQFAVFLESTSSLPSSVDCERLAEKLKSENPMRVSELKEGELDGGGSFSSDRPDRLEFDGEYQEIQIKLAIRLGRQGF